jgi:hypothetical protein
MTTERQRQANRANGRASVGPKTVAGKARVRFNALRHGLATRVLEDDRWGPNVEPLSRRLAGENANADLLTMAREVAQQQIELVRMRAYRLNLIERAYQVADPSKLAEILTQMAKELAGIDRYEQRALSRRKFAIRELDQLRAETMSHGGTREERGVKQSLRSS